MRHRQVLEVAAQGLFWGKGPFIVFPLLVGGQCEHGH